MARPRASRWRASRPSSFRARRIDETLVKDVDDALRVTGLPAEALEPETTEYAALKYEDPTGPLLKLHEKGVRLAFDYFGTGYALLNYLTRFPVSASDRPQLRWKDHRQCRRLCDRRSLIAMAAQSPTRGYCGGCRDGRRRRCFC